MFAETCVFDKQSKEPIYCGPQQREPPGAPLIANLRGHFAEFLNHRSPERLRILISRTCVSFSTVDCMHNLAAFLGRPSNDFENLGALELCLGLFRSFNPRLLSVRYGHFYSYRSLFGRRPSIEHTAGAGMLTCYPSSTPFSLD